jgi:hypothetical protein
MAWLQNCQAGWHLGKSILSDSFAARHRHIRKIKFFVPIVHHVHRVGRRFFAGNKNDIDGCRRRVLVIELRIAAVWPPSSFPTNKEFLRFSTTRFISRSLPQ